LTWIAIELSHLGEQKVEEGTLLESLRSDLGVGSEFPVFIPALTYFKGNKLITLHLMEGYVFVGSGLMEAQYFSLERRPYVTQVMSIPGGPHRIRALSVIPNSRVDELKTQLRQMVSSDLRVNDRVRVLDGTYRSLEGKVVGFNKTRDMAFVHFRLRSLETVATIPMVLLESF